MKRVIKIKHLKLICTILTVVAIYLIYSFASPNNITYLALGDSFALGENPYGEVAYGYSDYLSNYLAKNHHLKLYTKKFATLDARIKDVKQDILLNRKVYVNEKSLGLKSSLREASIITLSIGANDIISHVNTIGDVLIEKKIDDIIDIIGRDLEELLTEIEKYNKNIILVGYYNLYPKDEKYRLLFEKLDQKYQQVSINKSIIYISMLNTFPYEKYLPNPFNIHPSVEGYEYIYKKIVQNIIY